MRPEESAGADWNAPGFEISGDWEPFRPSDSSNIDPVDGRPIEQARGYSDGRRLLDELPGRMAEAGSLGPAETPEKPRNGPRWAWSEDSRQYQQGDRIRASHGLGDGMMNTVPAGTKGRIIERRDGVLGETLSVEFDNGYRLDRVQRADVERRGWLD